MKTAVLAGFLSLMLVDTAFAQMCGSGMQQSGAATQTPNMSAMSCMGMKQSAADDPMADKPQNPPSMAGMMCPCCKSMAMMGGMKQGQDVAPKEAPTPHKH